MAALLVYRIHWFLFLTSSTPLLYMLPSIGSRTMLHFNLVPMEIGRVILEVICSPPDRLRPRQASDVCAEDIIVQRACAQAQTHTLFLYSHYLMERNQTRPERDQAQDRQVNVLSLGYHTANFQTPGYY